MARKMMMKARRLPARTGVNRRFTHEILVSVREWLPAFAQWLNAPPLPEISVEDALKGFLELVRYGVLKPDDPLILDSLRVVDSVLKVDTPVGPCWRRYNHDGYGQRDDGGPYIGWGKGRAWPLLTGERAHYELAAGKDIGHLIRAMENFACTAGLLPEQIWDAPDYPEEHMFLGGPTTAAMPLMWAHAEYIKLLRSVRDNEVFDFIPEVAARYQGSSFRSDLEIWKPNRQINQVSRGMVLRIQAPGDGFILRWSQDEWRTITDSTAFATDLGISFIDIPISPSQATPIEFTFLWQHERWEGTNYRVNVRDLDQARKQGGLMYSFRLQSLRIISRHRLAIRSKEVLKNGHVVQVNTNCPATSRFSR
jgi:glucoamylase